MKKLLALALVTVLALSLLSACTVNFDKENDGGSTPSGSTTAPKEKDTTPSSGGNSAQNPADVDFGAIMGGGAGNYTNLPPAEKQALIDAGKAEGVDVTFETDGSVRFEDADGFVMVQKPDGTWAVETEDGTIEFQTGGDWPDNEYTRLIPKPDFTVTAAVDSGESFAVMFTDATLEQIKAYAETVKAAGFSIDAETEDVEMQGMVVYSFTAQNAEGYSINIYSMSGKAGLNIEKPYD